MIPATGGLLNSTVSSLIKLLFQPRRCAAQTCNDLFPINIFAPSLDRPVWCGTVCHGSDIAGLVRALNEFCFTAFLRRALDCLRLRPRSTNEGLVIWCGLIVSLAFVYVYPAIEMVEEWRLRRSRRERPRANAHARSLRPPMGRHSRSMGGLKGVPPTSRHPGGCQRSQLAPGKPRVWPLVQLF